MVTSCRTEFTVVASLPKTLLYCAVVASYSSKKIFVVPWFLVTAGNNADMKTANEESPWISEDRANKTCLNSLVGKYSKLDTSEHPQSRRKVFFKKAVVHRFP
ncbi:unnamed protein product, partial [Ectocarpus sp. 12 AP-2014]